MIVFKSILLSIVIIFIANIECSNHDFNFIIFTQHWPVTVCAEWEESKENNKCSLPNDETLWTIHGIWPTKIGTMGPFFCNNTWHFNPSELEPILTELEEYWTNIESNTPLNSFWKHEWVKHGTCAATLPQIPSQLAYFQKGLDWLKQYEMSSILARSGIKPSQSGYTVQNIYDAVKMVLGKDPIIQCIIDKQTKLSLINEIRICFDTQFNLTNCDLIKDNFNFNSDILTNCDLTKSVMYFDKLPIHRPRYHILQEIENEVSHDFTYNHFTYMNNLFKYYNIVQTLIWLTI